MIRFAFQEEATKEAEEEMQTHQKESAFKKFEKITVQGEERVGKLLRASQALLKDDQAPEKRNMYLEYAPQFVYPLIQEEVEGLHLDFTVRFFLNCSYVSAFSEER